MNQILREKRLKNELRYQENNNRSLTFSKKIIAQRKYMSQNKFPSKIRYIHDKNETHNQIEAIKITCENIYNDPDRGPGTKASIINGCQFLNYL
jgi:hypothetical protein